MTKRRRSEEETLQRAVADFLDLALPEDAVYYAVPNGGGRSKAEAGILRATGVKAGIPDIAIVYQSKPIFIELKTPKGRVSKAQESMFDRLTGAGALVVICRSVAEVSEALSLIGITLKARAA